MIVLAFVLAVLGALWLGFYLNILWNKVKALEAKIVLPAKSKSETEEPISTFIDEDDVVQRARFEQQEIERKLNPEKYSQMSDE